MGALGVFEAANRMLTPSNFTIDRRAVGYIDENGLVDATQYEKDDFIVDQAAMSLGGAVIGVTGSVRATLMEVINANLVAALGLNAFTSIASPGAGDRVNMMPQRLLPSHQLEFWGLGPNSTVIYRVLKGEITNKPEIAFSSRQKTTLPIEFMPVALNTAYPLGFMDVFDAVSGALTCTTSPADSATDIAVAGVVTLTFNKPMTAGALHEDNFTYVVDSSGVAVPCTAAFGTRTVSGLTLINPFVITLTPDSSLTAATDYTVTVSASIPAVDGSVMTADVESTFTTAA